MPDVFESYPHPIKLILSDLDGTITAEEIRPVDCEGLHVLRGYNERSRRDPAVPPLSVITGRPHSYVEAFARFLGTPLPSIFESGCGLHFPDRPLGKEYAFHPALADSGVRERLRRFRAWADDVLIGQYGAGFIVGKEYALSYAPADGADVDALLAALEKLPDDLAPHFAITRSAAVVDITPKPVDKGAGVEWLLNVLRNQYGRDIDVTNVVGIGDSFNDLAFLRKVGIACAVANAAPRVKETVAFVSAEPAAAGVADVYERAIALNRRLGFNQSEWVE